jgi:hypothetical protein
VITDVEFAASRGQTVELISGNLIPAAVLLLAIASARPPDVSTLEQRLTEYRQSCRRPSVMS